MWSLPARSEWVRKPSDLTNGLNASQNEPNASLPKSERAARGKARSRGETAQTAMPSERTRAWWIIYEGHYPILLCNFYALTTVGPIHYRSKWMINSCFRKISYMCFKWTLHVRMRHKWFYPSTGSIVNLSFDSNSSMFIAPPTFLLIFGPDFFKILPWFSLSVFPLLFLH